MVISSNNKFKFIFAVILVNLSMVCLMYFSIRLSIEKNNSFDGIIGVLIGGSLLLFLDVLFICIRKYIFIEVKLEDESVKLFYFNREIAKCKKEDVKLIFFNKDTVFLLKTIPPEIDKINLQKCITKDAITFKISCDNIKHLLAFVNTLEVYVVAKYSNYYSNEIEKHSKVNYL